jgi:hypothetical protein
MLKSRVPLGASRAAVTVNVVVIGNVLQAGSRPATFPADAYDVDICPAAMTAVMLFENSNPLHSLITRWRTVIAVGPGSRLVRYSRPARYMVLAERTDYRYRMGSIRPRRGC